MGSFETIRYDEADGVAWVTLDRPEVHNAFNARMREELAGVWRELRGRDEVRCVVLTASGDKAFCVGVDRSEITDEPFDPLTYTDPGTDLGPRSNGLWTPVIAAVQGMACGGAFYLLGECDFIIASEDATFFDPHVTYGMTAVYEPVLLGPRMPFGELMRMTLMGNHERVSAKRASEIGFVSEVVPRDDLHDAAERAATAIASQPGGALRATVRALWAAREMGWAQAHRLGAALLNLGSDPEDLAEGQRRFASGERIEWRLR